MKLNWTNLWTGGSVIVLVASEILVCFYSGAWAIAGLLKLGPIIDYGLIIIATVASVALTVVFARLVLKVEPFVGDPRQDGEGPSGRDPRSGAVAASEVAE